MKRTIILACAVLALLRCVPSGVSSREPGNCDDPPVRDSIGVLLPNGILVKKAKFVVYLVIGHSNTAGALQVDTVAHPRIWSYHLPEEVDRYEPYTWIPAKGGIHVWQASQAGGGPAVPFLKNMAERYPHLYFGVVQNGQAYGTCEKYQDGEPLFSEIVDACLRIGDDVTFGGILCMLGICEAGNSDTEPASRLAQDMAGMVQAFRDTLGVDSLPFLLGELEKEALNFANWPQGTTVDHEILSVPDLIPNSFVVPSHDIPYHDNHHYTLEGHRIWASRAAAILCDSIRSPRPACDASSPYAPDSLFIEYVGENSVRIAWESGYDHESFIYSYLVYIDDSTRAADTVSADVRAYTVSPINRNVGHTIGIRAFDGCGNHSRTRFLQLRNSDLVLTAVVENVAASSITESSVHLSWYPIAGLPDPVTYNVYQGDQLAAETMDTATIVEGMTPGQTYLFHVTAHSQGGGKTVPSEQISISTLQEQYVGRIPFRVNCGGVQQEGYAPDQRWISHLDYGYDGANTMRFSDEFAKVGLVDSGSLPYTVASTGLLSYGCSYRFRLPPATYLFRFWFCDLWAIEPGSSVFGLTLEGEQIGAGSIDPSAHAGAGVVFSLADTLPWQGGVAGAVFEQIDGWTLVNCIEVSEVLPVEILSPKGSEVFRVGDTVTVEWRADLVRVSNVVLELSTANGRHRAPIHPEAIATTDSLWGRLEWLVPDSAGTMPTVNESCAVIVSDYNRMYSHSSDLFAIRAAD